MQRSAIILLGIAYFGYKYLPSREEKNVLALVETKGLYSDELPKIKGLKAAFRVLENLDDSILNDDKKEKVESRVSLMGTYLFFTFLLC